MCVCVELNSHSYICDRVSDLVSHATPGQSEYWETRGFRRPRNTAFTYRWKLNTTYRQDRKRGIRQVESSRAKTRDATSRKVAGPITVGNHLSDGTSHRQPERERERGGKLRFSRQTEANQTKPKSERLGTDQLSQAHPQPAKRQTI